MDSFVETVCTFFRKEMNLLTEQLASNRCKTLEDYRHTTGIIRGLATAEEYVKDLASKMENAE